ncbi:MAG: HipA domain-containing protein [Albidovulum sp.]|nr:HipA domain-containing protein [Albidovulum sp.]
MPNDLPDALLVERFDIRQNRNDRRKIAMEDIASIRGVPPPGKYERPIEQAARALRGVSSDADADVAALLGRAVFAWLIADGDFHLQNMAVLRVTPDGALNFSSVRFAPTFDAVTARAFPGFEDDDLALSLAGKRNRFSSKDFVRAGAKVGISAQAARECVESLYSRLGAFLQEREPTSDRVGRAFEIWKRRIETTAG